MPELPEVETVKRGLSNLIIHQKIVSVASNHYKSFPNPDKLVNTNLVGAQITSVRRRAKVLMIDLSSAYSLVIHLKMTGQLVYRSAISGDDWGAGHPNNSLVGKLPDRSTRVQFVFEDGSKLFFNDQRKFGWVKLIKTELVPEMPFMQKVGPEPLSIDFNGEVLRDRLKRKPRSKIKAAILDQSVVAGIGNIYADESLLLSKIHPETPVEKVSKQKLNGLAENIKKVLQLSIDLGGSSSQNYVDAQGLRGDYLAGAYAYKRQGEPCRICAATIKKIKVAGRGTHYCPKCQKKRY